MFCAEGERAVLVTRTRNTAAIANLILVVGRLSRWMMQSNTQPFKTDPNFLSLLYKRDMRHASSTHVIADGAEAKVDTGRTLSIDVP